MTDQPIDPSPGEPKLPLLRRMKPFPFAILTLGGIFFLYQFVWGLPIALITGGVTERNVVVVRWAQGFGQVAFMLVPTVLLGYYRHRELSSVFRLHLPEIPQLVATMIGVFALQQMLQTYMIVQDAIPLPGELQRIVNSIREQLQQMMTLLVSAGSPLEFLGVVTVVAVIPAIAEELLFRGLIQSNLEIQVGGFWSAMLTGVIFGMSHLNPFDVVPLVVLGAYLGFVVYRSGNIFNSMSVHFFNNFIACAVVYLHLNDDFIALHPSGKASPSIILVNFVLFAVVFLLSTLYFLHITRIDEDDDADQEFF
jgi:membrane protease YdiL (CAAX protease family)